MIRAIDEIFDSRIKTFLDFSFEPFSGTGVDRVRNQNTFVGYVKYGGMKVVLKSLDVTEKFGDLSFGDFFGAHVVPVLNSSTIARPVQVNLTKFLFHKSVSLF